MGSAAVKKRRTEGRKHAARVAVLKFPEAEPPHLGRQALSLSCAALGLLFGIALVSEKLITAGMVGGRNITGPLGHFIATLLLGFFGWCALLPVAWLGYMAWRIWGGYTLGRRPALVVLGCLGVMGSLCVLTAVFAGALAGGSLGSGIASPLQRWVGAIGAGIFSFATLLLFLGMATEVTAHTLVAALRMGGTWTGYKLFIAIPALVLRSLLQLSALTWGAAKWLFGVREEAKEPVHVPKPRLRRNVIAEEDDDEEEDESASESEVLVRRRNEARRGGKEIKRAREIPELTEDGNDYFTGEYEPPDLALLLRGEVNPHQEKDEDLRVKSRLIENKLKDFGILGRVTEVHPGPVVTLFEFEPAPGVKVARVAALSDDLAMTLKALAIRVIAPIPGKGTVGIEVPNGHRELVRLRDVLESQESIKAESILTVALGKDVYGDSVVADIATMPHVLIAGATGTGKSVCINVMLLSLLYRAAPTELGLILIDPKILELSVYENIPHLRVPVVTSPKQARGVLEWAITEMNRRYRLMKTVGARSLDAYNRIVKGEEQADGRVVELEEQQMTEPGDVEPSSEPEQQEPEASPGAEELKPLPKIVIVIDELADLMLSVGREIEDLITRLAQKARASGIHLIVATQRPSVDVVTGLIKANFPTRLSFQVATRVDSRTIIDSIGAEKLLGKGDMLYMPPGVASLKRVHGAYVSDEEVKRVVAALKRGCKPKYDARIIEMCERALKEESDAGAKDGTSSADEYDEFYDQAVQLVMQKGQASTSMVQRAFRIGYNRAARIIEVMEREGLVGAADGAKPREVLHRVADEAEDDEI